MPSFILIHRTVWPQYTNVTDSQTDRTEQHRQTDRQLSDRTGQTVLQTVAQKTYVIGPLSVCLSVLSCPVLSCPVYDVGVLWPNVSTDQDET